LKNELPEEVNFELKRQAFEIYEQMTSLNKVVDFMLDVNKKANYEELELKSLVETLFEYDYAEKLEKNNIFSMVEMLDDLVLIYNRKALEDVFENLITNSIKSTMYNIENKIIKCKGFVENNNYIINFSDNGYGIEPDKKDKIFDIYYTTTQNIGGSGIGLFIVKTRLESIGGSIELIENEFKPNGATFKIVIPIQKK